MDLNWMISVDDHVIEPPNLWRDRLPKALLDEAPQWRRDDAGEAWFYQGARIPITGMSAVSGVPKEERSARPLTMDAVRPGCFDPKARVLDMDLDHVAAQVVFPTFARFCGQTFTEGKDKSLALLCVMAYNDWMIEEWSDAFPGRFIPLIILPLWDPKLAAREIERCAALGAKTIAFSEQPSKLGLPSIHDARGYWNPVFSAASDAGLPLSIHIGSSSTVPTTSPDNPMIVSLTLLNFVAQSTMVDWLFSGQFQRHSNLRIVLSEGGISWMPGTLAVAEHRLEEFAEAMRNDEESFAQIAQTLGGGDGADIADAEDGEHVDPFDFEPMELFKERIFGCQIAHDYGWSAVHELGSKNVMVETDYPHPDSSWPDSLSAVRGAISSLSESAQYDILRGNAERVFNFQATIPETTPAGGQDLAGATAAQ